MSKTFHTGFINAPYAKAYRQQGAQHVIHRVTPHSELDLIIEPERQAF